MANKTTDFLPHSPCFIHYACHGSQRPRELLYPAWPVRQHSRWNYLVSFTVRVGCRRSEYKSIARHPQGGGEAVAHPQNQGRSLWMLLLSWAGFMRVPLLTDISFGTRQLLSKLGNTEYSHSRVLELDGRGQGSPDRPVNG